MADQQTLPGVTPPRQGKKHADRAAKQRAYREQNDLQVVALQLPRALNERFNAWLKAKGREKEKSALVAKAIETQILRKR
ncbi:hypothetical protein [Pseudoduganella armeniaca]|uniref:Protein CopB n=1 Tax=Pseudoduganella armeniaca TaxID=2072590 RepID=A0A2R4CB80_9BURK|nr:hypothetical protein [Pseudoduganella armeniaca]AVR96904.1 hypothetical protein C9I28_15440 [Pseudoduganella armeniaca]